MAGSWAVARKALCLDLLPSSDSFLGVWKGLWTQPSALLRCSTRPNRPLESIAKTMSTPLNKYCWNCKSHLTRWLFQTWRWPENSVTSTNLATELAAVALLENQRGSSIQHFQKAFENTKLFPGIESRCSSATCLSVCLLLVFQNSSETLLRMQQSRWCPCSLNYEKPLASGLQLTTCKLTTSQLPQPVHKVRGRYGIADLVESNQVGQVLCWKAWEPKKGCACFKISGL